MIHDKLWHTTRHLRARVWARSDALALKFDLNTRLASTTAEVARQGALVRLLAQSTSHAAFLLREKIIRRRDVVVLIHLQALDRVVSRETESVELVENVLFEHTLSTFAIPLHRRLWTLAVPNMTAKSLHRISLLWICGQQLGYQIPHTVGYEFRRLVISIQDLSVQRSGILILKWQVPTD